MLKPDNRPTILLHFEKTKNDVVRDMLNELHHDYLIAIGQWTSDPTIPIVGSAMLARLFSSMGCDISEYPEMAGYYYIDLPHGELQ